MDFDAEVTVTALQKSICFVGSKEIVLNYKNDILIDKSASSGLQ
jgi:hypothetical protein